MPSIAALRHAPWSLSKVRMALRCAQEFHFRYVEAIPELEVQPDARVGKAVHVALERLLGGATAEEVVAASRKELLHPEEHERYATLVPSVHRFVERIAAFRARRRVHLSLIEHRVAVRYDFSTTGFVLPDAFFRGVFDVGFLYDDHVLAVVDHKTGARRPVAEFADQLEGYALLAAAHMGHIRKVYLGVHFVGDEVVDWSPPVDLPTVKREFLPRTLAQIEEAAALVHGGPTPNVTAWCRRCSYRSICPAMRHGVVIPDRQPTLPVEDPEPNLEPPSSDEPQS